MHKCGGRTRFALESLRVAPAPSWPLQAAGVSSNTSIYLSMWVSSCLSIYLSIYIYLYCICRYAADGAGTVSAVMGGRDELIYMDLSMVVSMFIYDIYVYMLNPCIYRVNPIYIGIHTHTYVHVCVCVCVCAALGRRCGRRGHRPKHATAAGGATDIFVSFIL